MRSLLHEHHWKRRDCCLESGTASSVPNRFKYYYIIWISEKRTINIYWWDIVYKDWKEKSPENWATRHTSGGLIGKRAAHLHAGNMTYHTNNYISWMWPMVVYQAETVFWIRPRGRRHQKPCSAQSSRHQVGLSLAQLPKYAETILRDW